MQVKTSAYAGSLESSDVFVQVAPSEEGLRVDVDSIVYEQFGRELEATVREVLGQFGVTGVSVSLKDRGALACTVRARVETALRRAGVGEGM